MKFKPFILILIFLQACAPALTRKKSALEDDFQPFYYSYMEHGAGPNQTHSPSQIRFKGTHDSKNPNNIFFLIEPHSEFQNATNKISLVMWAGGLDNVTCSTTIGGVNKIDCLFRNILAEPGGASSTRAQESCANYLRSPGTASGFLQGWDEFRGTWAKISNGSTFSESVFEISSFFNGGVQKYSHAIFIPDLNTFCAGGAFADSPGSCFGSDKLPASSCYYAAELPEIPALLEADESF